MKRAVCILALMTACAVVWAQKPRDWVESAEMSSMLTVKEQEWGLPRGLAHCKSYYESRFDPLAVSRDGNDRGLDQINRFWQKELMYKYFRNPDGTRRYQFDWTNPEHSATVGCAYLADMIRVYGGSVWLGLVAYNWGPGNLSRITKWSDIPEKKRKYGNDILALLDQWSPDWAEGEKR